MKRMSGTGKLQDMLQEAQTRLLPMYISSFWIQNQSEAVSKTVIQNLEQDHEKIRLEILFPLEVGFSLRGI